MHIFQRYIKQSTIQILHKKQKKYIKILKSKFIKEFIKKIGMCCQTWQLV